MDLGIKRRRALVMAPNLIKAVVVAAFGALGLMSGASHAADAESCREIRFSDLNDLDLVVTTSSAAVVLEALGYRPETLPLSLDETFAGLVSGNIDVFLGVDPRKMEAEITRYQLTGAIDRLGVNLPYADQPRLGPPLSVSAIPGTTLATPGDDGVEVNAAKAPSSAVTPPNLEADDIVDIPGDEIPDGDAVFAGPVGIETHARGGFAQDCPNAAKFLRNLVFEPDMIGFISRRITKDFEEPFDAAVAWFKLHQETLELWLDGVKTLNGDESMTAVVADFAM